MNAKMLARMFVWLVILGVVGAGLTVCTGSQLREVAGTPTRASSEPAEVAVVPSPTPTPATDTPTAAAATQEVTEEPTEAATAEPTQEVTEEPTVVPTQEATEEPTVEPTQDLTEESMQEATEEPMAPSTVDVSALSSDNCVNCHTNEETLQALAEDKKVTSEASSGEG